MMRIRDSSRERRFCHNRHAPTHIGFGTCHGTIHKTEDVIGRKCIDLWPIIKYKLYTDSTRSDVFELVFFWNGFEFRYACGQINPGDLVCVTTECHSYLLLGG